MLPALRRRPRCATSHQVRTHDSGSVKHDVRTAVTLRYRKAKPRLDRRLVFTAAMEASSVGACGFQLRELDGVRAA